MAVLVEVTKGTAKLDAFLPCQLAAVGRVSIGGFNKARRMASAPFQRQTRQPPRPASPVAEVIAAQDAMTRFRQLAHANGLKSGFFENLASVLRSEEIAGGAHQNGNRANHRLGV
jgi:hypothetical protein